VDSEIVSEDDDCLKFELLAMFTERAPPILEVWVKPLECWLLFTTCMECRHSLV